MWAGLSSRVSATSLSSGVRSIDVNMPLECFFPPPFSGLDNICTPPFTVDACDRALTLFVAFPTDRHADGHKDTHTHRERECVCGYVRRKV